MYTEQCIVCTTQRSLKKALKQFGQLKPCIHKVFHTNQLNTKGSFVGEISRQGDSGLLVCKVLYLKTIKLSKLISTYWKLCENVSR